jgi:hypothetical protein
MKLKQIALLLLMTSVSLASPGQSVRSEYYAVIPFWESQVQPFKGAVPITKIQAQERIHLRLDYDSLNRVIQSNVMIGTHLKAFQGFMKLYIDAPLIRVEYQDAREVHSFYDHFGEPTEVMNGVFRKIYEKDESGRNVKLLFLDRNGSPAEDHFGYVRYEWTHTFDGAIIEERFTSDDNPGPLRVGFQFMRTRMIYGPDGYPQILHNIDEAGNLVNSESGAAIFKYYYDVQGRFDRWEVFDKEGNPAIGPSDTSGEQNVHEGYYLREIRFFDTQGAPVKHWSGAEKWVQSYDRFGNRTIRAFHTYEDELMNGYGGYAQSIYTWSTDGRWLQSEHFLDENGNPTNHSRTGVSKVTYQRDESGVITDTLTYEYVLGNYELKQ